MQIAHQVLEVANQEAEGKLNNCLFQLWTLVAKIRTCQARCAIAA